MYIYLTIFIILHNYKETKISIVKTNWKIYLYIITAFNDFEALFKLGFLWLLKIVFRFVCFVIGLSFLGLVQLVYRIHTYIMYIHIIECVVYAFKFYAR